MTSKSSIVRILLRLYPAAWRREYGLELEDLLMTRALGPSTVADVAFNALRQRVRHASPATLYGLTVMSVIFLLLTWNIVAPPATGDGLAAVLRDSPMTLPTIAIAPLTSYYYLLLVAAVTSRMASRHDVSPSQSGMDGIRICAIASLPIVMAGVLMLLGILHVEVLRAGQSPTTFAQHGFTYTFYDSGNHEFSPIAVLIAPMFRILESWMWGTIGGAFGRRGRVRESQPAK